MNEFEDGVRLPENWFRLAWQMFEAAKVLQRAFLESERYESEQGLYRRMGAAKGANLLLGLALENALKGAITYKSPPDVSEGRLKTGHFHKDAHTLLQAAEKLELSLTGAQADMLERLTHFLRWASKYPTATTLEEHQRAEGMLRWTLGDIEMTEELIRTLQEISGYDPKWGWPVRQ